jgi:hypothetical protein
MEDMKGDMSGGARGDRGHRRDRRARHAAARARRRRRDREHAGGGAYRPGDILTAMNGKTIEIINTDAEGRLVLADALWYAREQGATHLVDIATLDRRNGAALSGDVYSGVFGNVREWRDAGRRGRRRRVVDHAWPLPIHRRFRRFTIQVRRPEELVDPQPGDPRLRGDFLQRFRRRGTVGALRHRGAVLPLRCVARATDADRGYGVRRCA